MDAAERALLEATIRTALDANPNADAVLADLGWLEMLEAEPRDAIDIVFTALGATNATATALDDVVVSALGLTPRPDLAVLLPPFGAWMPDPAGLATARVATAREIVIMSESGPTAVLAASVEARAVHGIDPTARLHTAHASLTSASGGAADARERGVAMGRRAVSYEILGVCRTMLDLACTHTLERIQFGKPVASFQAVRHRLADALVAVEALDATLAAAADEPNSLTAALAKATAGRTARTVASNCQQVLAGIGFTTDHPFHRYLKRTMLLEGVFGSADAITADIGHQLLAARRVPTLIEL